MATWVYFGSIAAVQSKLRGLLHLQTVGRSTAVSALPWITTSGFHAFTFSKHSVGPDHLCKVSPSDGPSSSWTQNHFSKHSAGTDHLCSLFSHPATDPVPPGRTTSTGCTPTGSSVFPFSKWWSRHRSSVMQRYTGILGADSLHRLWAQPAAILSWQTRSTSTS